MYFILGIWVILSPLCAFADYPTREEDKGIVLIVASYNPDTKRMSEFITDFERHIIKNKDGYRVLIEDLGCKGIYEAPEWNERLTELMARYKGQDLRAVILLGQEAWASFLMQKDFPRDIPFFGCFASRSGIELPIDTSINMATWRPESIDMENLAKSKGQAGGLLNVYDVKKNIELIRSLYPNTQNIAFVSDNTYGGLSLQALVKKEMAQFRDLNLITLDSREIGSDNISNVIKHLPENTTILIGTWRVDQNGMYLLNSAINYLVPTETIPIFSLTGTGIGSIAIGGYIPAYRADATLIAEQIHNYYYGEIDSTYFEYLGGEYIFDKQIINKLDIKEYQLPKNSQVINKTEDQLRKYRMFIIWSSIALCALTMFVVVLYRMYYKNKKLKDSLIENEKQLIISKERAEESGRLKSAFLANMSHEIRTPLNAIVGFSTLLCDESMPAESKTEFSQIIMTNSNLLLTLINDILDVSRLDTGKISFDLQDEDIDLICRQVISTTEHLRKPSVEYIYKPSPEAYMLKTDMQRLSQVLINLITNANKFTDKGSITVGYNVVEEENTVYFYVTDTGCGIPTEMHSKVFNRFEKLDEYKQGTGLGLAICEQITSRLGGNIWIDPDHTNGSRFMFSHPIHKE